MSDQLQPEENEANRVDGIFKRDNYLVLKYIIFGAIFTGGILLFSVIMSAVSASRNELSQRNYNSVGRIYNGPLEQEAPSVNALESSDRLYVKNTLTEETAKVAAENVTLQSTDGTVVMDADFVKKGLAYQPTYRTKFNATYVLNNSSDKPSAMKFDFPFPVDTADSEISNARLLVDDKEIEDAKAPTEVIDTDNYYYDDNYTTTRQGLQWQGEIAANTDVTIKVSYDTVGLSEFSYEGLENPKGSQNFTFAATINGIRSYNVDRGLSVDSKEFGADSVTLLWDKQDLYSSPAITVEVGDKLNPSTKVSRVYLVMAPLYIVAMTILLFLSFKFGRKMRTFDVFLVTILYILYFPLVHYLSSFTIDPTMEVFASFDNVGYYSMPLYGAFLISWVTIGGMILYLFGRLSGMRFTAKFILPSLVLFLGFFPLVLTVPEYSILLSLIGITALMAIVVQTRIQMMQLKKHS